MKFTLPFSKSTNETTSSGLRHIRRKFRLFLSILESNNTALKTLGDMEEKAQGNYIFDVNYLRSAVSDINYCMEKITDSLIELGGEDYIEVKEIFEKLRAEIEKIIEDKHEIKITKYTIPFSEIDSRSAEYVGSKNAQLGELKKIGIPTPGGFAVTSYAYKQFVEHNNLQASISEIINEANIMDLKDLELRQKQIKHLIDKSEIPKKLAREITESFKQLRKAKPLELVSVRSSAIGEDTGLSFAGQYASYLSVREDDILERYKDVLSSKFTPKAVFYFLSHSLVESELAMSAGFVSMVDSRSSGVIYTKDPVHPEEDYLIINSIYGLGKYLVDGTINPDVFIVYPKKDFMVESHISTKKNRLVMNKEGGVYDEKIPHEQQNKSSLDVEEISKLAEYAVKIEKHYEKPQDIEWAVDSSGKIFILQTRPLQLIASKIKKVQFDTSPYEVILKGGTTVCPGAGTGPVKLVRTSSDLENLPEDVIIYAKNPFPGLITAMDKASALMTEVGGIASHMATIAREYRIPTIVGIENKADIQDRMPLTVDASNCMVFKGYHPRMAEAFRPEYDLFIDDPIYELLDRALEKISPLNLINTSAPLFTPGNIKTYHDITRYAHQRAIEEMFREATEIDEKERIGIHLKTDIPLEVEIINIDKNVVLPDKSKVISEDKIFSEPMQSFWQGIKTEGWPRSVAPRQMKALASISSSPEGSEQKMKKMFSKKSFAILGKEFMILNLKMGYHFATIEAMATEQPNKNYVKLLFKDGGAEYARRKRRVCLLAGILAKAGFENNSTGDFLDAELTYDSKRSILQKLYIIGRLSMMTKQLDMALQNDSITEWYKKEFTERLGLI